MERTLKELADYVGGEVVGNGDVKINGVQTLDDACEGHISFIANEKYVCKLNETQASAIIVGPQIQQAEKPLLVIHNPYLAYAKILKYLAYQPPKLPKSIDPAARIGENVSMGEGVTIFHNVSVGNNVTIGNNVTLYPGVFVGDDCKIDDSTVLHPNTVLYQGCIVGKRVTIHSNSVIGSPGFGYAPDGKTYFKIPHVGIVVIEDDVDIEPNSNISRGVLGQTRIKRGAKIGALVAISHNVEVGEDTLIVSQAGIAGSAVIGNNVTIAAQAGIVGHIKIGDNVVLGGRSGVSNDIPPNGAYLGAPAQPLNRMRRIYAIIKQLPEMFSTLQSLKRKVDKLEKD